MKKNNGLVFMDDLPSGKRLQTDGQSPLLLGTSTISMAMFDSKLLVYKTHINIAHD